MNWLRSTGVVPHDILSGDLNGAPTFCYARADMDIKCPFCESSYSVVDDLIGHMASTRGGIFVPKEELSKHVVSELDVASSVVGESASVSGEQSRSCKSLGLVDGQFQNVSEPFLSALVSLAMAHPLVVGKSKVTTIPFVVDAASVAVAASPPVKQELPIGASSKSSVTSDRVEAVRRPVEDPSIAVDASMFIEKDVLSDSSGSPIPPSGVLRKGISFTTCTHWSILV